MSYCSSSYQLNCDDPYSIIIHTIFTAQQGLNSIDLIDAAAALCPTAAPITDADIQRAFKRGLLTTEATSGLYVVNAAMADVNNSNRPYSCICQLYR